MFISYRTGYSNRHTTTIVERRTCCDQMDQCWRENDAWDVAMELAMPSTGGINEREVILDAAGPDHDDVISVPINYCPWCGEKIELEFVGREP